MSKLTNQTLAVYNEIDKFGPIRPFELASKIGISIKNTYKHLGRLLDEQMIKKTGHTPRVYYKINADEEVRVDSSGFDDLFIEQNYIYVSPTSQMLRGIKGFAAWCNKNNFDIKKEKQTLVKKLNKISSLRKNGVISARHKLVENKNKQEIFLNHLYYGDFYTIDHFGKTKLGQLVYVGKSSQNKEVTGEVAGLIKQHLINLIAHHKIRMIGFIPPTVDRKMQFMSFLNQSLKIDLPELIISKVSTPTKVAQKTLRKFEDRVLNAKETIAVNPNQKINGNVLLIDDAVGSGSTLNQTAGKIKKISHKDIKVIGYSVVGSMKGFEVISEV